MSEATTEHGAPPVRMDHNATTDLRPEVAGRWRALTEAGLGNPSSLHASGRAARDVIDQAREQVAAALGVHEDEVTFTAGGTEANNLALFGRAARLSRDALVVGGPTEHASVQRVLDRLEAAGRPVRRLAVDGRGRVNPEQLAFLLESRPVGLVTLQAANSEVGTVQPLEELAALLGPRGRGPTLHVDAVQALGRLPLDLDGALDRVDLLALSLHKVGGPLGVGVLVRRKGTALASPLVGGGQEEGLRPGTENAAAIGAAALAVELAVRDRAHQAATWRELAGDLWAGLAEDLPGVELLGPPLDAPEQRLPNTLGLRVPGQDARLLVTRLDMLGLECSAGSACSSGAVEASHVLLAMGLDERAAREGLRLSLGRNTTASDCKRARAILVKVISPLLATRDTPHDL